MNKLLKVLFIIALILIPICIILTIYYAFLGKTYLKVNSKNEETILKMLEENENIAIKGKIKEIGKMQGLGDWYLYIIYEDGSQEETILDDGDLHELYMYIKHNGKLAGTKGIIVHYIFIISVGIVIIYALYKICMYINKKTDEIIEKQI